MTAVTTLGAASRRALHLAPRTGGGAPRAARLEGTRRVRARSGLDESQVRAIMATQLPRAERLARADDVIDNGGPREALVPAVRALDERYRALAARPRDARP